MSVPQFGWVGFHEEERAFQDVCDRQDPARPVFCSYEELKQPKPNQVKPGEIVDLPAGMRYTQAPEIPTIAVDGIDSGFMFWPYQETFFPDLRPGPQNTGSCVAYSDCLAAVDQMAYEFLMLDELDAPFCPVTWYSYGCGRVIHGRNQLRRQPGSTGSWQIASDHEQGYLPRLTPGLPGPVNHLEHCEPDNPEFEKWAYTRSALEPWIPTGKKHRLGTSARLQSYDEVREAILTPPHRSITIASSQGFADAGFDSRLGIRLHRPKGSWAHQMFIRGIGTIKGEEVAFIGNQWNDFHGDPGIGPIGGFWLRAEDMHNWCRRAVIYARGNFVGREQARPNFGVI